ncbi:hypothetical protein SAMN06265795_11741 [Noviherbaspirillum humi]|uniref:Cytokinin riboside 5'-monophosphate phosphoribohydrolase n=1 Tax=Noviherbaspirillum humi TaxID=1688639 RepID=A0A239KSA2_9BURK|nr:TIGR00730 family Rossman fold protein [Noviherbaspirillum humi]SNT20920.1 hypothetical protein SAMN06265795_11741 [Noviherbaspirillum humi]
MKSICVYCGSSKGKNPAYVEAARALAGQMVNKGIGLVYGGGRVGLMGEIANEILRLGGEAVGVIPQALMDKEVGHRGLTKLHVVKNMHERKALMAELADGFIAMPGGIGTFEELFEIFTWFQLGFHTKPIGLLNAAGFYDGLIAFLQHTVNQGFVQANQASMLIHEPDAELLLDRLQTHRPVRIEKVFDEATAKNIV